MKSLFIVIALCSVMSVNAADEVKPSELKMKGCLSLVYSKAVSFKGPSKDVMKLVSGGTKACRDGVREMVKTERETKKRSKIQAQILKLQAKLK